MTIEATFAFFLAIILFAITPGPGVFAILARALTKGAAHCFTLALGMAISDIVYFIAACFGLAALATQWGDLFTAVRFAGFLYLVYLGWKMWTAPVDPDALGKKETLAGGWRGFLQGFLISASNPKVILFYIAFLPTFIDITALSVTDISVLSLVTLTGLMIGLMSIAAFASEARRWFRSERAMRGLNRTAGSIMIAAGVYIVTRD